MEDWGEGPWGGVGSFHSQSNSDNDQFSVVRNKLMVIDSKLMEISYLYRIGNVFTISRESVILFYTGHFPSA